MPAFRPPDVEGLKANRDVVGLIKALDYQQDDSGKASSVRQDAARALGELGDPRAVEPLIGALGDSDTLVRTFSAESLGKIGDARAVQPLMIALRDSESLVRAAASAALGRLGDAGAATSLAAILTNESDKAVCLNAAEALDRLGWEPVALDRNAAWYFMAKGEWGRCVESGSSAVEPLLAVLADARWTQKSMNAAWALGEIGDTRAVRPLTEALKSARDERVRFTAAEALGRIGHVRAVNPLIAALEDDEWAVRKATAEALISVYRRGGLEEKTRVKILALRARMAAMHKDEHADRPDGDGHRDVGVEGTEFLL